MAGSHLIFFSSLLMLQQEICASENTLKKNMPSSSQDKRTQTKAGVSAAAGIPFLYIVATVCTVCKWCGWQVMGEEGHTIFIISTLYIRPIQTMIFV